MMYPWRDIMYRFMAMAVQKLSEEYIKIKNKLRF
jgi:hypothetical protein